MIRLIILFLLCTTQKILSQEPEIHISHDAFWNVYYDNGQIVPNKDKINFIDYMAETINNGKIPTKYTFRIEVGTCIYGKNKDSLINYKRVEYLLSYLEQRHKIKRSRFSIDFFDSELCGENKIYGVSFINFALQNCKNVTPESLDEIFNHKFEKVTYKKNNFIFSNEGRRIIDNIATEIINTKESKKYRYHVLVVDNNNNENDSLIEYKRINYFLTVLKRKYNIDSERIQFQFFEMKDKNNKSFFQFSFLNCE